MSVLQEEIMQKPVFLTLFLTGQSEYRCQGTLKRSSTEKGGKSQEDHG